MARSIFMPNSRAHSTLEVMEVLIAEDEAAIREVEAAYLRQAGYRIIEAADGNTAQEAFHAHGADLVLIDINLPGLDGIRLCKHIRQSSTVPILMVTAKDGDEDELLGLAAGADDYIKKPFNPRVLVARVHKLLGRQQSQRLVYDDLVIDPARLVVSTKDRHVRLTVTQFNILFALASQPNAVLTRDQLIAHAYDDPAGHDIYDRTIDAHIKSIRRAIEPGRDSPQYIQTVIGQGYTFNVSQ